MDTKKLRQKILDLAIRGKLVPQDPNDEPASVLLERIRAEKERLIKEGKIKRSKKTAADEEIDAPFEIPESWVACKLEDIAYIGTGATPDTRNNEYYNGIIPWVSSSCTKYDCIDTPTSYITQKAIDETNCRIYPKGTLIMAMYGEGKTRGQISELKIDAATNQACAAIVPYNIYTAQYIKQYLKRSYLHIREQAEGGNQPNLNLSKIAQYDIFLPPLHEQQRIVNEINRWFAVIDALESNEGDLLKAIDQAKFKILDLAIHGKLVPQDPNDESAIEHLKRINPKFEPYDDTSHENLPKGWVGVSLKSIGVEILNGFAFKSDLYVNKGIKIIRITNVQDGFICDDNPKYYPTKDRHKIEKYMLYEGDLLMSLTGNVGRVGFLSKNMTPAALNQRVGCLRVEGSAIEKNYLYYYFQSNTFKIDCEGSAKGVAQLNISTEWLKSYILLLPPIKEQRRIINRIEELFAVLDSIKESLE